MTRKSKAPLEFISGIHSVKEALRANRRRFHEIYSGRPLPESIAAAAREKNIPVIQKTGDELAKMTGTDHHQQVAARTTPFPTTSLSEMVKKNSAGNGSPLYLVIDSVEDPRNLGALIRTAVCAGVSGVILPKDRCAPLTPAVSRASAGAMEHCDVCRVTNLVNAITELKKHGIWFTGLDIKGRLSIYDVDMTGPHALVIGGENTGIRRLVAQTCDNLCHIPQGGPVNSLNASVAGAIAMYEALRQRREKKD
jgi:23S rRNA (guanosine2251-2'-O)-methyltransferase